MPLSEEELSELGFQSSEEIKNIKSERDKWKTSHAEAEIKISQQGNELGTLRGRVGEFESKSKENTSNNNEERPSGNTVDEDGKQVESGRKTSLTLSELKKNMTKSQRNAAELVYKGMSDEDKSRISTDEELERAFLEEAITAVKPVRASLFEEPKDGSDEVSEDKVRAAMRALFNKHVETKNVAPGSSTPTSITGLTLTNSERQDRFNPPPRETIDPVAGSILEASKRKREMAGKT